MKSLDCFFDNIQKGYDRAVSFGYEGKLDDAGIFEIQSGEVSLYLRRLLESIDCSEIKIPELVSRVYLDKEELVYLKKYTVIFNKGVKYVGLKNCYHEGVICLTNHVDDNSGIKECSLDFDFRACKYLTQVNDYSFSCLDINKILFNRNMNEFYPNVFEDSSINYLYAPGVSILHEFVFYNTKIYKFCIGEDGIDRVAIGCLKFGYRENSSKKLLHLTHNDYISLTIAEVQVIYSKVSEETLDMYRRKKGTSDEEYLVGRLEKDYTSVAKDKITVYLYTSNRKLKLDEVKRLKFIPFSKTGHLEVYMMN